MLRFCSAFLLAVFAALIKVFGFISRYVKRSKPRAAEEDGSNFSANHSREEDHLVSKNSTVFLSGGLAGKESLDFQKRGNGYNGNTADAEGFDCLQSGLIANSSKYEFMSGRDVCGYVEEPKSESFFVQEMFVGSSEVHDGSDQCIGCRIPLKEDSLEKPLQRFDEESDSHPFCFKLFDASCSSNDDIRGRTLELESVGQEKADDAIKFCWSEKLSFADSEEFGAGRNNLMEDEILEDKDISYEVEFVPVGQFSTIESKQEPDAAGDGSSTLNADKKVVSTDKTFHEGYDNSRDWMSNFLEESDWTKLDDLEVETDVDDHTQRTIDVDDEYIELKPQSLSLTPSDNRGSSSGDTNKFGKLDERIGESDGGDDEDELDVLLEHQNLVQQMKMELKNSRIRSLPAISEEECETPEMVEALKPLEIDHKIEYKDIVDEIQKFYKSYIEKMRRLDILNYQTVHAISFLQLKVSDVLTGGTKTADSVPFTLPRIRRCKGQRIYADPMHKSIIEMHRDLELVYVGQLCLSWEILCWMYVKAQELLGHDSRGNHSYNRAAEEFQQFQVLLQRFVEDEPFQGQRIQNYVKSRCMIKYLLQIPTIRGDCLKAKQELKEEIDMVSLEMLIETIGESMLVFREFLFADKQSVNISSKGILETKPYLQNPSDLNLLTNIITSLHKKERKIKEHMRIQNCILRKLKKHQESRLDHDAMTSQVELRLVSRVLSLSRLTTDQLIWCQNKLKNISFEGRKVHVEPSFLLFPC